jgi:FemAB-related protein (PEP-CTERM system-associated)
VPALAPVVVEPLSPETAPAWDAYVAAHPRSTVYHLRLWQGVAQRAYGLSAPFLVARRGPGGELAGLLPLFVVPRPFGPYLVSGLFGAYGPTLADDEPARLALLDHAARLSDRLGADYLVVKVLGDETVPVGYARAETSVIATLALGDDPQRLWKGFRDKIRNSICKAEKSGLEVRVGRAELDGFYDVLAENMHRKGTPIYGHPFLRELVDSLGEQAEVVTLHKGGEVVSGALAVYFKNLALVPFASSRAAYFSLNPNNLIYWEIMKRAIARGAQWLDFGRSPRESSTLAFKTSWGAVVEPEPFFVWSRPGKAPHLDASDASTQRLIQLWQRLPRPLADALGPSVCRRFLV